MDFNNISIAEQQKYNSTKREFRYNNFVLFAASVLMLILLFLPSGFYYILNAASENITNMIMSAKDISYDSAKLLFEEFYNSEWLEFAVSVTGQLLMILLPVFMSSMLLISRPKRIFPLTMSMPNESGTFFAVVMGFCYTINILFNLIFARFIPDFAIASGQLGIAASATTFTTTVIIAPIFEELFFRGVFLQSLMPYNKTYAIFSSALIFGLMHRSPPSVVNAMMFGILIGIGFAQTKSILVCVLLHMLNNAISVMVGYLTISLNDQAFLIIITILIIFLIGFAIAFITNLVVTKNKSFFYIPSEKSNIPRLRKRDLKITFLSNPFFWLFVVAFAGVIIVSS